MRQSNEVSEQSGLRWFVLTVLVAILIGTLLRMSLAPAKIERLVRLEIEASQIRDNLVFGSVDVSLASGWWPELALVLNRVEWRAQEACSELSPVRARRVRIPVRLSGLIQGKIAAGRLKIDDLTVDLDDLKNDCSGSNSASSPTKTEAVRSESIKNEIAESGEIWSEADQARIAAFVGGVSISRAEIFFENRMKSVVLEDFSAAWRGDSLSILTSLRFPPATVFGENLPNFTIKGTIRRTEMIADIRAELSEGMLEASSVLKPVVLKNGAKELEADLSLSVSDLPLSVVTPLLTKSRIVSGAFRPKFIWLDCAAKVHGIFSRLFVENPVALSQCEVSGQVGRLNLQTAIRMPDGKWQPFAVRAEKIEIARVLETFGLRGPSGVFANFGQVSGTLQLNSPTSAEIGGSVAGAVVRFAGGEGAALQPLSIGQVEGKLQNDRWTLLLSQFEPDGGTADLTIAMEAEASGKNAKLEVDLKHLKLSSRVEKAIFSGTVKSIAGTVQAGFGSTSGFENRFENDQTPVFSKFNSSIVLDAIEGSEIGSEQVKIDAQLAKGSDREIQVSVKSPHVEVLKTGKLYRILQPSLLGWGGEVAKEGSRLVLGKVVVKGRFREDGFEWKQAQASVGRSLQLSSHGVISRNHVLTADLEAQYPLASRLKWTIEGTWLAPKFSSSSPELTSLFAKAGLPRETVIGTVPPRLLGVPVEAADSPSTPEKRPEKSAGKP